MKTRLLPTNATSKKLPDLVTTLTRWFDAWAGVENLRESGPPRVDWIRCLPFVAMHLMCLGVVWVSWS
jgi:stearoyl-CoA desaturase (delta-9 desaturase)